MLDFEPRNIYDLEYTDTFNGQANYSWVHRYQLAMPLSDSEGLAARQRYDRRLKRRAKAAIGLTGVRGTWEEYGDTMEFRPRGMCTVLFVSYRYD